MASEEKPAPAVTTDPEGRTIKRDHRYPHGVLLRRCLCDWPEDCRKLTIFWSEFLPDGKRRDGRRAGQIRVPPHKDNPNTPHRRYTQAKREAYMSYVCGVDSSRGAEDTKPAPVRAAAAAPEPAGTETAAKKKKDRNGQFIALHHFPTEYLKDEGKGLKNETIPLEEAKTLNLPKLDMVPVENDVTELIPEQPEDTLTSEQIALAPRSFNWSSLLVNPKSTKVKGASSDKPMAFVVPSVPWSTLMQEYHDAGGKRSTLHYYRRFMADGDGEKLSLPKAVAVASPAPAAPKPIEPVGVPVARSVEEEAAKVAALLGRMDNEKEAVPNEFLPLEPVVPVQDIRELTIPEPPKPEPLVENSDAKTQQNDEDTNAKKVVDETPPPVKETQEVVTEDSNTTQETQQDTTAKAPEEAKVPVPSEERVEEKEAAVIVAPSKTTEPPTPNADPTTKPAVTHKAPIPFKKRKVEDHATFSQGSPAQEIPPSSKTTGGDGSPGPGKRGKSDEMPGPLKKRKVENTSDSRRTTRASTRRSSAEAKALEETSNSNKQQKTTSPPPASPAAPPVDDVPATGAEVKTNDTANDKASEAQPPPVGVQILQDSASQSTSPAPAAEVQDQASTQDLQDNGGGGGLQQVEEMQKELARAQDLQEKVMQSSAAVRQRQRGNTTTTSRRRKTKLPTQSENEPRVVEGKRPRKKRFNL